MLSHQSEWGFLVPTCGSLSSPAAAAAAGPGGLQGCAAQTPPTHPCLLRCPNSQGLLLQITTNSEAYNNTNALSYSAVGQRSNYNEGVCRAGSSWKLYLGENLDSCSLTGGHALHPSSKPAVEDQQECCSPAPLL